MQVSPGEDVCLDGDKFVCMKKFFLNFIFIVFSFSSFASTEFIKNIENKNWKKAIQIKDPDMQTLVIWLKLNDVDNPSFNEITQFIKNNPTWPRINQLIDKVEESDFQNCKKEDILEWFKKHPPKTAKGRKRLVYLTNNLNLVKQIWHENTLSKQEEKEIFKKYYRYIDFADTFKRIEYMLYNHQTDQAVRALSYIPKKLRKTYEVSIKLQQNKSNALSSYKALDKQSKMNLGIIHNLAHYYEHNKDEKNLIEILAQVTRKYPKEQFYFWNIKSKLIRTLIKEKQYKIAYLFSSFHGQVSKKDLSEAEWLAGWIALRFLNQPEISIGHFKKLYNNVKLPISLARGAYWLGKAYEASDNREESDKWFKIASQYHLSFYGQLASCKINDCNVDLPTSPKINQSSERMFNSNPLVKAAILLEKTRYCGLIEEFIFKAVENSKDEGEIALITKIGFKLDQHHLSVESAKHASYKGVHVFEVNYPILKNIFKEHPLEQSLVMALIRQESVFNKKAISSAGARGLMQIMPFVAKETAKSMNIRYHINKLIDDPHYNTMIGISHLHRVLNNFNGSYILSIAAYNAGDKAVKKWIEENSDPRFMAKVEDVIDWIEKISYHETRNYVQRVLEGKSIYNVLIFKEKKYSLLKDLFK